MWERYGFAFRLDSLSPPLGCSECCLSGVREDNIFIEEIHPMPILRSAGEEVSKVVVRVDAVRWLERDDGERGVLAATGGRHVCRYLEYIQSFSFGLNAVIT
jgi:hypothetical protein